MNTITFDNKIAHVSLEQLRESMDEVSLGHKPLNGIRHIDVFDRVLSMAEEFDLKPIINPIIIADAGPSSLPGITRLPIMEERFGKDTINAMVIRRLLGSIKLLNLADERSNATIAISFHQNGFQMAYGQEVKVCSNLSILGGKLVSSYGENSIKDITKMFEVIHSYLQNHSYHREVDNTLFNRMWEIQIDEPEAMRMIGELKCLAVKEVYLKGDTAPLNITQTTEYAKEYLKKSQSDPAFISNLYGMYNIGTGTFREGGDITAVLPKNKQLGIYMMQKYDFKDIIDKYKIELN